MATSYVDYTGDGNATKAFSFPSLAETDVKVEVDGTIKTATTHYNITSYTTTGGGNVVFTSGNIPTSSNSIRIYRDTDISTVAGDYDPQATYTAGSSVKAEDLNNNQKQALYAIWEEKEQTITTQDIKDGAITSAKILDGTIVAADIASDAITTAKIAADAVTGAKIADDSIDSEHLAADSIDAEHYAPGSVDATALATNAVTTVKITDANVTTAKLAADAVTGAKIADDSINSEHYVDGSIDTAHIADSQVTTAKIAADAITGAKVADDAIDSEHYTDGSIDTAHIGDLQVTTAKIAADAITGAKVADDALDSEHYTDGSIDTAHIADANVTLAKIENVTDGQIIIGNGSNRPTSQAVSGDVTIANTGAVTIANDAVEIGMIGCEQTTITDSDSHIPTSGAVVDYVAAQLAPIGGLEVIADDESFPNTIPAAGVVVSISDAAGLTVNSSGVSTNGDALDNSTITINGFPSELRGGVGSNPDPYVFQSGAGLMVVSTGSSQTYNYHQAMIRESDFVQLSDDINDFNNRYRINAGEPGSNNDDGDLVWDTTADKMKVYDATAGAWKEVTSTGEFKYLFLCPNGGTGAPTINGSIATYDLREVSNSGSAADVATAAQLLVSINGVVQKANTGTSAPSEGFAMVDGNTIVFGSNLPTGAEVFVIQIGSAVSIPTPGDGTVSTAKFATGAVNTAALGADCVTGAKIADDAIDSEHLAADSIDAEHYAPGSVDTAALAGDSVDGTKIADNAIDSEHYTDGSIDHVHLAADAVDGDNIADDSINSEHYADGSIDTAHIADDQVTLAKMAGLARGKIIYGDSSGNPAALAVGTANYVLKSDGTDISWGEVAAGAAGAGSDKIFWENGQTVTGNYTITNNMNAMSAGPITINSGVTVTVGTGETWTIV